MCGLRGILRQRCRAWIFDEKGGCFTCSALLDGLMSYAVLASCGRLEFRLIVVRVAESTLIRIT
jgi:hypothetical protein